MPYSLAVLRRDSGTRLPELEGNLPLPEDGWHELTLAIVAHEYDIEAVVLAEADPDLFGNRAELGDLIDRARAHLFGAPVALALLTTEEASRQIVDHAASVRMWIEKAVERGVIDFFELPEEEWGGEPADVPGNLLRGNLDRCRENHERLLSNARGDLRPATWKIRPGSRRLNRLFTDGSMSPGVGGIRVTVIDVPMASAQLALVPPQSSPADVIALLRCVEKAPLEQYRNSNGIGPPLLFSTELEALYFARAARSLAQAPARSGPLLLITHAFDPQRDPLLVVAGSRDVAAVLKAIGPRAVHVIVRQSSAPKTAATLGEFTARTEVVWLHLGHGEASGLEDADGAAATKETWVNVFRGSGHDLVAAVLLACDSFDLATALRTGLASLQCCFGFRGELGAHDARRFAEALLPGLLQGASNRELQNIYLVAVDSLRAAGSAAEPFVSPSSLV